jgi:hypothetical protein
MPLLRSGRSGSAPHPFPAVTCSVGPLELGGPPGPAVVVSLEGRPLFQFRHVAQDVRISTGGIQRR